jgi:hypothetical protein
LDAGEVHLYTGTEAEAQYQVFERERQAYRDRVWEYYQATTRFRQRLEAEVRSGKPEEQVEIPEPPAEPAPLAFFSTTVNDGFAVELPAGTYTIQLRGRYNEVVPFSKKKLVVFSARRDGIGYDVVPQDKWTIPEQADDPSHVLYARSGTVIYLQPFFEKEYNELYITRLEQPQSTSASEDRWTWIHTQPKAGGVLEVLQDGWVVDRIERKPYLVRQTEGTALGYEVLDYPTDGSVKRSPDFEGYEIRVGADRPAFSIRLVEADGTVVAGSEREVRLLNTQRSWPLYVLSFAPLVAGVVLTLWRRGRLAPLPKQGEQAP